MKDRRAAKPSGRTIVVVDDHAGVRASVRAVLEDESHRVLVADSGPAALALLGAEPVQVMLVDYCMPGMSGPELIRRVHERDPLVQIVLQTGQAADGSARELVRDLAIQGYHDKADTMDRLLLAVDLAIRAYDRIAELHVAERLKTELLASVSHEFRTPLNVIVGYVDLLRENTFGACPPDAVAILEKVHRNAAYLLDLVGEFLDLSKLDAGSTNARHDALHLTPFLRELGEWFALLVRARPVRFACDVPDDLPAVSGKAAKLRVVVQNLLSNAEKFTQRGEIVLSARPFTRDRVAIQVRDTGPGIAAEYQESIFDVFQQLGSGREGAEGVGLGLALARRFARMMGGDITVESVVGRGSTFTVVLPVAPAASPGARNAAA
jgi:signal transduction histidine kinase